MRALVPAAAILAALALSSCSDDEEDTEDTGLGDTEQTEESPAEEPPAEEPVEEEPAPEEQGGGGESVEPVAAGTYEYTVGDASDPIPYEESDATAVIEVTATQVELGTNADLEGIFEPDQIAGMIPAHVYTTITNLSGDTLEFSDPGHDATTVNADGSYGTPAILIGTQIPGGCTDEQTDSVDIAVGDTVEQCASVLIPEGGEPTQIMFMASGGEHELLWALN